MKRILSAILILITVLSCVTFTVSAEEAVITDEGRLPFEDVKQSHWFYESVGFCYANEIIKGMNEYTFGWNGNLTRAQFVLMLATIDGADLTRYQVSVFDDVKPNHWYYSAIAWAYETKLTSGVSATKFGANDPVTRSQMARFMMTYMAEKYSVEIVDGCLADFTDADKIRDWAVEGIKYSVSAGLISGMEMNGKLCVNPDGTTTRAQAAVIFRNFILNYYYGECEHEFTDAACTESAVCGKCGLVNGLPTGHTLAAYDCVTGGKCSVCEAEVEPSKLIHDFAPATCTDPRTCTRCGATRGEADGHSFKAATCTTPKICTVCNTKEGNGLGHTTSNGICERCKKEFFPSPSHKVIYYLKAEGEYLSETNSYVYAVQHSDSITLIGYNPERGSLILENYYYFDNGDMEAVSLDMPFHDHVYTFEYVYVAGEYVEFMGTGSLDAYTFTKSTVEGFSNYMGKYDQVYTDNLNEAFAEMLADADFMLNKLCGMSIKDIDFKVF